MAHSIVEAEIVASNTAVRTAGLPALDLWESVPTRHIVIQLVEDDESTYHIIKIG